MVVPLADPPSAARIVYIQVHHQRDIYTLEVMDYQHMSKDRSLGVTELSITNLLKEGDDKETAPWVSTGRYSRTESLKIDGKRSVKGSIEYEVEFCESSETGILFDLFSHFAISPVCATPKRLLP